MNSDPPPRRGRNRRLVRLLAAPVALAVLIALGVWTAQHRDSAPPAASPSRSTTADPALTASFTLLDGRRADPTSLRGRPLLVWFVAAGCASCAVSIPAVAKHLDAFVRSGTRVLVLGLYGAFGEGASAARALADFGESAAGPAFTNPGWTWGVASEQLTVAYDPDGVPDAYYLLDRAGRVIYHDEVPVTTMSALLAHLPNHVTTPAGNDVSAAPARRAA